MARAEIGPSFEPHLGFSQRFAVRLDNFITGLTDTRRDVAQIPLGELHDKPNTSTQVELHRRHDNLGRVRKIIAHIKNAEGRVIGREVFGSEIELKQTWGRL